MRRLAIALAFVVSIPIYAQRDVHEPKLAITVRTLRSTYRMSEKIELEIQLCNIGREALLLRRQLGWGVGRTNIRVLDSKGKEVFTTFLADELPPPPQLSDLIELEPNQFFGERLEEPLSHFVKGSDTYDVVVDYTSHISEEWAKENLKLPDVPLWSRERGTVESNRIRVIVTK